VTSQWIVIDMDWSDHRPQTSFHDLGKAEGLTILFPECPASTRKKMEGQQHPTCPNLSISLVPACAAQRRWPDMTENGRRR
jgi:hypothetical protein